MHYKLPEFSVKNKYYNGRIGEEEGVHCKKSWESFGKMLYFSYDFPIFGKNTKFLDLSYDFPSVGVEEVGGYCNLYQNIIWAHMIVLTL